jgi:hypothetical protein
MYTLHYIIPILLYFLLNQNKRVLFGLLIGNLVDLDHIYLRVNGTVPWLSNICEKNHFWNCSSFGEYPLHSTNMLISLVVTSVILFFLMKRDKELKITYWMFWISIGALLNLLLDYVQLLSGIGFVVSG